MTELIVTSAIALFVAIDPLGVGAIFVALTKGYDRAESRVTAIKGASMPRSTSSRRPASSS